MLKKKKKTKKYRKNAIFTNNERNDNIIDNIEEQPNSFKNLNNIEEISDEEIKEIIINNDNDFDIYFYFKRNDININSTQIITNEEKEFFHKISNNLNSAEKIISNGIKQNINFIKIKENNLININNNETNEVKLLEYNNTNKGDINEYNYRTLLTDLNINENVKKFSYKNKDYYIYTPAKERNGNTISWKCNIFRSKETYLKGKRKKLCYGQISYILETKKNFI